MGENVDSPAFFLAWWFEKPEVEPLLELINEAVIGESNMNPKRTKELLRNRHYEAGGRCYYLRYIKQGVFIDI